MVSLCNVCSGSCACCLSCEPWSFMCMSMGSTVLFLCVCRWCMLLSVTGKFGPGKFGPSEFGPKYKC